MEVHHHLGNYQVDPSDGRFPQWSLNETREFLSIRAELDRSFMETKRNRLLWDLISNKMMEKGFHRSPEQCKCKWKNLVTRYKMVIGLQGSEAMEPESARQFPFQEDLRAIFAARMQRLLWLEAEGGAGSSTKNAMRSEDEEEESMDEFQAVKMPKTATATTTTTKTKKKRKVKSTGEKGAGGSNASNVYEMLEGFLKQQVRMEMEWWKGEEAREEERKVKEREWRERMEAMERERVLMERSWREREEQRQGRDEARAERRDALITALLNRLVHDST